MTKDEAVAFLTSLEQDESIKDAQGIIDALKNTREEAKSNREKAESLEKELENFKNFKTKSKSTAINRELKAEGIKNPERIYKLLKHDDIEFSEDGSIKNLDAQLELVRADYPELFDTKRNVKGIDQFSGQEPEKTLTATERQLQALKNKR